MYRYSGMHRDDGLVMMMGPNVRPGHQLEGAHITDLAPTILNTMGVPIPNDMDGRPLGQAFVQQPAAAIVTRPATPNSANGSNGHGAHSNGNSNGQQRTNGYTREEALSVEQRLRAMGYLG
jgi:arylsulfatase A-like enzyme